MDVQIETPTISMKEQQHEPIEQQIHKSEKSLGIESEYDRQLEASLFIDKNFLSYALITGIATNPERIFGDKAWDDYLDGRLFARQYGKQDLTPDFIQELHRRLTQRSDPKISGKIRDAGVIGASYDDEEKPMEYTTEQVRAIEQNPQLSFIRIPPEDGYSTTGFIAYPHPKSGTETQEAITKDLEELCEWFNNAKNNIPYNPHVVAGILQRRLISLHPFLDSNGRLARMLMNWSLENDGEAPSVIDNPDEDILTDEETWISYITEGSKQYKGIKQRQAVLQEAGIDNISALFDLGQDKAFYEYLFRYLKQAPPLPINGDKHKHEIYEEFLAEFKVEMDSFQEYMRLTTNLETADGTREVFQGGFITPEFIQFASSTTAQLLPLELRKQFFTDTEAYRGGMVDGEIDDEKICQMFQRYTGVGTGYRSLQRSHLSAASLQRVNPQVIQESMEYYDKMFASTYLQKKHPDVENPYANAQPPARDLNTTIREHTAGGEAIWNSPFASTSLNYRVGRSWATRFGANYAKNSQQGILLKVQLPREGMVLTFGKKFEGLTTTGIPFEYEALVTGGIQPGSITGIEVYDKDNNHGNPGLRATRVEEDSKISIVVEDRRGEFVITRTYAYSPDTASFKLTGEVVTDIPSAIPIEQPPAFDPYGYRSLQSFIGGIQKKYESPFKYNENHLSLGIYNFSDNKKMVKKESIKTILTNYKDNYINKPDYFSKINPK